MMLLEVISGHLGSVSCLALCGEFVLSASLGNDIIVWQQPDLRQFARFGQGEGSVKAIVSVGNKIFTAHQDVQPDPGVEGIEELGERVPAPGYTPHHERLLGQVHEAEQLYPNQEAPQEPVDTARRYSISCLAVSNGLIYSGSWDKTLKVWGMSNLRCLESIKAHDDAINGLVASKSLIYTASSVGREDKSPEEHIGSRGS
ncbi:hypothetical protein Dimus_031733 [Dionaea muscipula]